MELGFCAATPVLARCPQRRRKNRTRCVTRMQIEPNRRRDNEGHPLLRAPEAIAAIFTVGAALFRDILRGDGEGIRNRLNARVRAQAEQKARSKMLLETQKEVRSLNQAIIRERERAKPMILEKQNVLNRVVESHAIEALANAVTDDDIELPPEGILKGDDHKRYEAEIRQLISKAREARSEFRQYINNNNNSTDDKRSIEDIEAETSAADALAKQYQMELKDVNAATKLLEEEKQAEMSRLKNVLETHQKRIHEFRKIAEQMEQKKRAEEAEIEALKSKSTPQQEIASEQSLREVRKEVTLANKIAKNIVQTATKAVKSAEDGDMKAVDELGDALKGNLNKAEIQMKKSQKKKRRKERKMRLSAVENVLGMMQTETEKTSKAGLSAPASLSTPTSKKKGTLQTSSSAQKSTSVSATSKAVQVPSGSLPAPASAKPSLEQKLEPASTVAPFFGDSSTNGEEIPLEPKVKDAIEEAASTVEPLIQDASRDDTEKKNIVAVDDVFDDEILKNEIELALALEEFEIEQQKGAVGEEEKAYLELEEPPKELLESISTDLDIIESEKNSLAAPALLEDDEEDIVADFDDDEIGIPVQNRRRWSADDEMGDLNDSDVLKATDDEEVEIEAEGELPNITDGFSIEDLKDDGTTIESDHDIEIENGSTEDPVDEGSFGENAVVKNITSSKKVDDKIEPFAGAEGKKETLELLRIIEFAGEGVAREGATSIEMDIDTAKRASSTNLDMGIEKAAITNTEAAVEAPKKRRRGRPRKLKSEETNATTAKEEEVPKVKRKRGRPRKTEATATTAKDKDNKKDEGSEVKPKRKRGRPRKNPLPSTEEPTST